MHILQKCTCLLISSTKDLFFQISELFVRINLLYLKSTSMCISEGCVCLTPCYAGDLCLLVVQIDLSLQTWYKSTECFSRLEHFSTCACLDFVTESERRSACVGNSANPPGTRYPGTRVAFPTQVPGVPEVRNPRNGIVPINNNNNNNNSKTSNLYREVP